MYRPLKAQTIERISLAQVPVQLPEKRKLEIALEVAEQGMVLAYAADMGDSWYRAWRRSEEVRAQMRAF